MSQTLNSFIKMKKCASPLQPHTAVHLKYLTAARQLSFSIQKPPLYTRTAPNLFLTKTTKLTSHGTSRYPASSSYPIRSPTATLYQKKPTRVFGRLWKLFLPEPIDHILVVLSYVVCFVWFLSESCLCRNIFLKIWGCVLSKSSTKHENWFQIDIPFSLSSI